ncbi:MAG: hypothetical protein Q7K45_04495 [Nanoarchaeota archaeon]|nr:hypothetical protein [Nanoarchaeota archaeon]
MKKIIMAAALGGVITAGVIGSILPSYLSASRHVVEAIQQLEQKEDTANVEIKRIEENYTDCQRQQEECLSKITQHPRADGKAYRRVDDFLDRFNYGTTYETAYHGSLNTRNRKNFSEIIGIADVLLQCQQELSNCTGEIKEVVQGISKKLYNEQHALAYLTLCPQSGILNRIVVDNLGLTESTRRYCPFE